MTYQAILAIWAGIGLIPIALVGLVGFTSGRGAMAHGNWFFSGLFFTQMVSAVFLIVQYLGTL